MSRSIPLSIKGGCHFVLNVQSLFKIVRGDMTQFDHDLADLPLRICHLDAAGFEYLIVCYYSQVYEDLSELTVYSIQKNLLSVLCISDVFAPS
jgi:hypothetical protein